MRAGIDANAPTMGTWSGRCHSWVVRRPERLGPWAGVVHSAVAIALLVAFVAFVKRPDWQLIRIDRVEASTDDDVLAVTVVHARCPGGPRVRVVEEAAEHVAVRAENNVRGDCDDIALTSTVPVDLKSRLGDRRIELQHGTGERGAVDGGVSCQIEGRSAGVGCGVEGAS